MAVFLEDSGALGLGLGAGGCVSRDLLEDAVETVLACPACHGSLRLDAVHAAIHCTACRCRYLMENGIPVLFSPETCAQLDERRYRDAFARRHQDEPAAALLNLAGRHHCAPVMKRLAAAFRQRFDSGQWILDLGIGFGWQWDGAPDQAKILGIDMSIGNLLLAKKVLNRAGSHVLLVCADAAALPVKDRRLSGVWSVQVFQHFPQDVLHRVQMELERTLTDRFAVVIHNLHPAALYRLLYLLAGKSLHRRDSLGHMEVNRYSATEWTRMWAGFVGGRARTTSSYSELFFHPEFNVRLKPYPFRLEELIVRLAPTVAALCARQIELRIESRCDVSA